MPRGCCRICRKSARCSGLRLNCVIDQIARAPQRAQRGRRHAFQFMMLLQQDRTLPASRSDGGRNRLHRCASSSSLRLRKRSLIVCGVRSRGGRICAPRFCSTMVLSCVIVLRSPVIALHQMLRSRDDARCRGSPSASPAPFADRTPGGPRAARQGNAAGCADPAETLRALRS